MPRPVLFLAILSMSAVSFGQRDTVNLISGYLPGINIAYTGSLIYPGFSIGAEVLLKTSEITGAKRNAAKHSQTGNQLLALNLNYYHHRGFHNNLYLTAEWIYRKIKTKGFFPEYSAGAGFSRTFLNSPVYEVADNGTVSEIKHIGYNYALITAGAGIGFDLYARTGVPLQVFTKMDIIAMFPYNNVIYFRPVMEAGTRFSLSRYIEIRQKNKN